MRKRISSIQALNVKMTAFMSLMSIIISALRIICYEFLNRPRLSCVIKYYNPSNRHLSGVTRPQNGPYKHTSAHFTDLQPDYLHLDHTALQSKTNIYIYIDACSPSLSYLNHTHAHRATLKANQMLKGFSLGPEEDRLLCGDH